MSLDEKRIDGKRICNNRQWLETFKQYINRKYNRDIGPLNKEGTITVIDWNKKKIQQELSLSTGTQNISPENKIRLRNRSAQNQKDKLLKLYKRYYLPKKNKYTSRNFLVITIRFGDPGKSITKMTQIEKDFNQPDFSTKRLISKTITSLTDKKLRDKLMKKKDSDVLKTVEHIQEKHTIEKNEQNSIPEALLSTIEKQLTKNRYTKNI